MYPLSYMKGGKYEESSAKEKGSIISEENQYFENNTKNI